MSDSDLDANIVAVFQSAQIGSYFAAVTAALLAFEYVITFDQEVELFWKRKITVSSILFLMNRYVPLAVNLLFAPWPVLPNSPKGCAAIFYASEIPEILEYLPWAVFSALRAYVLSARLWSLACVVFLLSIVPIVVNYVTMAWATSYIDPVFGCTVVASLSDKLQQNFTIISRVSLITSDLILVAVTWTATYKNSRGLAALGQATGLSSVLLRDGVVYFIVLLIMNTLHLSFSLLSILNQNASSNASYLTVLTEPITAILISRFLIDLQEANRNTMHQHSLDSMGTLNFNRVVGSVGSSIAAPGYTDTSLIAGEHTEEGSSDVGGPENAPASGERSVQSLAAV